MSAIKDGPSFLLDENVVSLAALFPKQRAKTVRDYGFEGRDDHAVAQLAGANGLILVTNNAADFLRVFKQVAQKGDPREHLYGLLTVPTASSGYAQERWFSLGEIEKRLKAGVRRLTWEDVGTANLWVRLEKGGNVSVQRLRPLSVHDSQG